jgi:hypothetical protein
MVSIENMKPESRKPGRNVAIMPICVASSWVRAAAEMSRPSPSVPVRNANEAPARNRGSPRKGTWKSATPTIEQSATSTSPMPR